MSNDPRSSNFEPVVGVKDTLSAEFVPLSGIALSGVEAATVAIVDGSGSQITSFGGGTQYTDGGTPPTHPVGPTLNFNNAGTWATVGSSNPLPVTATVTGGATSANQTNGSQKTQIVDGSGNVIGSTSNALDINIKSGNITGFATSAKQDTGNTSLASIDTKTPALGQALAAASVPVVLTAAQLSTLTPLTSVTANAGTNLNTSLLALESGGNLAASKADLDTLAGAVSASKFNVNISSGSIANTSFASTIADGANVTLGAKADAKSTATDTTAVTIMQVLKEISFMEQNPASRAVTNAGTFAVQAAQSGTWNVGSSITALGHGVTTVTTAGTDVALAASTTCKRVVIQAQTDNTNIIAVGASGVDATIATGTGIVLYPGDCFELETDNLADIFIDSLVNGEGVRYTYFT